MPSKICRSVVIGSLLLASATAVAQSPPKPGGAPQGGGQGGGGEEQNKAEMERARVSYKEGAAAYRLGKYEEAAKKFEEAYRIVKFPTMLFNIAQSNRRLYEQSKNLDSLHRAIEVYKEFLRDASPTAEFRSEAQEMIPKLEKIYAT